VSFPQSDALLLLLMRERVSVFGTSPAYLQYLRDAGISPRELGDWPALRAIQSTGSILFDAQYHWVREHWKPPADPVDLRRHRRARLSGARASRAAGPCRREPMREPRHRRAGARRRQHRPRRQRRTGGRQSVPLAPARLPHDADGTRCRDAYYAANPGCGRTAISSS